MTFLLYRAAETLALRSEARATNNTMAEVDINLVLGAVAFGLGWGLTGFCPGPLIVTTAAAPFVGGANLAVPVMNLLFVVMYVNPFSYDNFE